MADSGNHRIQKFKFANPCPVGTKVIDPPGGVCFVTKWGTYGDDNGQLESPQGVAVGPSGRVYVADFENNHIQVFVWKAISSPSIPISPK